MPHRRVIAPPNRTWFVPLLIFCSIVAIYGPTASRQQASADVGGVALQSWILATTGQPWLDDFDFSTFPEHPLADEGWSWTRTTPGGHLAVPRSPGVVLAGIPGYWFSDSESISLVPQALMASLLAALTGLLFFLTLRRRMGVGAAGVATMVFALATPMWSVAGNALWTHTVTTLGIAGMAWASDRRNWWLVGLFGGVAIWGRVHTSLILAILGVGLAIRYRKPAIAAIIGAGGVTAMGAAILWTRWVYEVWSPTGGYNASGYMNLVQNGFATTWQGRLANEMGLWLSADRGVLVWTPALLVLFPALVRSWKSLPPWSKYLLLGGLVYTLAQGWFSGFHGGDAFYSYRLGLEFLVCAAPAFSLSVTRVTVRERWLLGPVLGLQLFAIGIGAVTEQLHLPKEEAWSSNSLAVALPHEPLLWILLVLGMLIGGLAQQVLSVRFSTPADSAREIAEAAT